MKKLALLLIFTSFLSYGMAPFGLEWGEDVTQYGELRQEGGQSRVIAPALPKSLSIADHYILYADNEHGLVKVTMKSHKYGLSEDEFNQDFNFIKQSLIDIGYNTSSFFASEIYSYKCVLQGSCKGKRWYGLIDGSTHVALEQIATTRETAFIRLEFKSPHLLHEEAQKELLKAQQQANKMNKDRLVFD